MEVVGVKVLRFVSVATGLLPIKSWTALVQWRILSHLDVIALSFSALFVMKWDCAVFETDLNRILNLNRSTASSSYVQKKCWKFWRISNSRVKIDALLSTTCNIVIFLFNICTYVQSTWVRSFLQNYIRPYWHMFTNIETHFFCKYFLTVLWRIEL